MSMRRIALFLPNLAGGGAERMFLNLGRGFAERGYAVDLVLARAEGEYLNRIPDGIQLIEIGADKAPIYGAFGSAFPLIKYLRESRPDALLSAMARINVVTVIAATVARTETRVIVSERNHLSSYVEQTKEFGISTLPLLIKLTYPIADEIVPISKGVADDLAESTGLNRTTMSPIYNPVVTPELVEEATEQIDHEWFRSGGPEVVLGAGSLSPQKDFPTLVRAVAHISENRDVRLVILGSGEERARIESVAAREGIQNKLWLPGFVDNPYRFMKRADIFALSSAWEGFGNVIVEAMACGTPVVSTNCPSGPAEILNDGEYGSLVPVHDDRALAGAIRAALADPTPPEQLRQRARDFSYDVISGQYLDLIFPNDEINQ